MKYYMYVVLVIGGVEILANLFFMVNILVSNSYEAARKFHGDFPPNELNSKLLMKVIAMFVVGVLAMMSFVFYKLDYNYMNTLYTFIGVLVLVCGLQAIVYGKNHKPAIGSLVPGGLLIIALVLLNI